MINCVCVDYDHYGPSVSSKKVVVARKEHRCCECHDVIQPGQKYELVKGCWEGKWSAFKTCMPCATIRRDFMTCGCAYGHLWEDLHEANDYHDDEDDEFDWLEP